MKYKTKIKKIGTSNFVIVPSFIIKNLNLKDNNEVEINIEKVNIREKLEIKSYKCKVCEYKFDSDDEIPYCPFCECENLLELEEEII